VRQFVVQLSRVRSQIASSGEGDSPSLVTNSFERVTKKYWVKKQHVTELKLSVLAKVPIFEISHKSPDVDLDFESGPKTSQQHHNFISSVYFDTDDLACYHRRVIREDKAWPVTHFEMALVPTLAACALASWLRRVL
jgi:SPX domain protein involved in polyphosphate accumulation